MSVEMLKDRETKEFTKGGAMIYPFGFLVRDIHGFV